jgi:hypothetical protein
VAVLRLRPNTANKLNIVIVTKTALKRIYSLVNAKQIKLLRLVLLCLESDILLVINCGFW